LKGKGPGGRADLARSLNTPKKYFYLFIYQTPELPGPLKSVHKQQCRHKAKRENARAVQSREVGQMARSILSLLLGPLVCGVI
jgi:hypothetical protein